MWTSGDKKSFAVRGFSTPPASWRSGNVNTLMAPMSERKRVSPADDPFHVLHKVPAGDSPYVRAKQVQLIDKDPSKAIALFWSAINSGDRVDSALKDMAVVMKQLDRSEEAIEAIKSFRHLCSYDSQESLNNVLVELYKRAGRIQEEIEILQSKLKHMEEGIAFGGRRTKTARSQGKKVQITIEQERSRILGNLAWAYLQQKNYKAAEEHYMKSLSLETDRNKQCNLAICLMHMGRISEARSLLQVVRDSSGNKPMDESYAKSFERAFQMLTELESRAILRPISHDENCCSEDSRSSMSPIKRNPRQAKRSLTYEYQHYESSPNFSRRMKENQGIPEVLFTQPRKSSSGLHNGHQTWGCSAGSAYRKLSFGQSPRPNKAHVARNLRDYKMLDTGKPEITFQNSVSCMSTPISRDWRRPQGDAGVQSVSQPISSGDWKGTSRGNNGCFQVRHEGTLNNSSQQTVIGDPRTIGENGGLKKSGEPQMGGENAEALETSIDGGQKKSSEAMAKGSMQSMNTCVESSFGGKTSDVADTGKGENQKPAPQFSMYSNGKKSWADMVEEEEQELLIGRTEYCHGSSNTEDEFHNENLNCNIMPESPCLQTQMKSLSQKLDLVGLKDEYVRSGSSASSRNSSVRRSLRFDQQQEAEAVDYFSSSPAAAEALNFEGSDSICGKNSGSGRTKRLQSFQYITDFQDSP